MARGQRRMPRRLARDRRTTAGKVECDSFQASPGLQGTRQGSPVSEPIHTLCSVPTMALLSETGAMEQLSLYGSRMRCPCRPGLDCEKIPDRKRPWLIQAVCCHLFERPHRGFSIHGMGSQRRKLGSVTQTASSSWTLVRRSVGDQDSV